LNQDSQPASNSSVTLINVFEVSTEHVDVFIAQWHERAALMSTKPAFFGFAAAPRPLVAGSVPSRQCRQVMPEVDPPQSNGLIRAELVVMLRISRIGAGRGHGGDHLRP
jgi:hypothetical protein